MKRYWKVAGLALLGVLISAPLASARPPGFRGSLGHRIHGRALIYGPSFYAPGWYGLGTYGWGWCEPYRVVPRPVTGKVKIETKAKDSMVYVDGGYVGTVKEIGTFPLKPGAHDIELRDPSGHTYFQQRVTVIEGKTVKLTP